MNIRLLNHNDVDIFQALRLVAVHESPSAFGESIAEIVEKSSDEVADQLHSHDQGDFVLGAFDDDQHLIGVVGFYRAVHAKQSHKGTLWGMYVTPARRRQGVGCALVAAAIERARNLSGIVTITLRVVASNEAAKRLYALQGFQVVGIEQKAIQLDEGYVAEALMQLLLPQEPSSRMRRRPSSRLLVIDQDERVLLFRFVHKTGALAGKDCWATPGGGLEDNETFVEAARRELFEETGIVTESIGPHIAERKFVLRMSDGEDVLAEERFFVIRVANGQPLSQAHRTSEEVAVVAECKWWSVQELATTHETVFPKNLVTMLREIGRSECSGQDS